MQASKKKSSLAISLTAITHGPLTDIGRIRQRTTTICRSLLFYANNNNYSDSAKLGKYIQFN
jgi:hypothetical protein